MRKTYLLLNIRNLALWELVLIQRHLGHFQKPQKPKFTRQEEQQTLALFPGPGCTADSVDIITRVIWWVELDDPVDFWDIEPTGRDVGTEQNAGWGVDVFEKGIGPLLLFLLALARQLFSFELGVGLCGHSDEMVGLTCRSNTGTSI